MIADVVIVGTGVSGLFCALSLPGEKKIVMLTKSDIESSDSYLAQGGICVKRDEEDFGVFLEDTMKAGHYENCRESVSIMIEDSREVIADLVSYGVEFTKKDAKITELDWENFCYTKEGAHSRPRILYHQDITGEEITKKLIAEVKKRVNITILEYAAMADIHTEQNVCKGVIVEQEGNTFEIQAKDVVFATGGIGGRYIHSTNFPHLTGDALDIAEKYGIALEHMDYVQIHPTTLYSKKAGRRFLISESVRGEGAILLDKHGNRFVNELLPRDVVTEAIHKQMEKDGTDYVHLSLEHIPPETIKEHFPNICKRCLEEGYDVLKEPIPVVPAQHYFMGGIKVDSDSKTSMEHLYAVGETSCNGVHGKNRLASNSLLESIVFAKRAAKHIGKSI
uniref:L-aspartate oxidase n=1 Tax=Agathobacter sp. TaxID=2021311 RepID=UPI0040573FFE